MSLKRYSDARKAALLAAVQPMSVRRTPCCARRKGGSRCGRAFAEGCAGRGGAQGRRGAAVRLGAAPRVRADAARLRVR